jgi:CelD/BcsL family acetyltransferase involved in cellulose biosynthesis
MMAADPILDEVRGSAGSMLAEVAGFDALEETVLPSAEYNADRANRHLSIFPAAAGTALVAELEHLSRRAIEPNVFFNPRFLAPAMPRLDDRSVRLAVLRDETPARSRMRMLFPFSVEKPSLQFGPSIIRCWATVFAPLGTPLIDADDPVSVVEDLYDIMGRSHLKLPPILVFPNMRSEGAATVLLKQVAFDRNLPLYSAQRELRPALRSQSDGETYMRQSIGAHHRRDLGRLRRKLEAHGPVEHNVARGQRKVIDAMESFLALEAAGWKGNARTAMAIDRYRAAFAREAVYMLAEEDRVRIHTLTVNGNAIAAMVVFIEAGIAYTWKTAFDEAFAKYSPGNLLLVEVTNQHLDDPNIITTDSCAVPDHPIMSRFWAEREPMETLIIGLNPATDRAARQVAAQINLYRQTRDAAKKVHGKLRTLLRR